MQTFNEEKFREMPAPAVATKQSAMNYFSNAHVRVWVLIALTAFGLLGYSFFALAAPPSVLSIQKIEWGELQGFLEGLDERMPEYALVAIRTNHTPTREQAAVARSKPFRLQTHFLQFQFQGSLANDPAAQIIIELLDESNQVLHRERLLAGDPALSTTEWKNFRINLGEDAQGKMVTLAVKMRANASDGAHLGFRSRLVFLEGEAQAPWFSSKQRGKPYSQFTLSVLACLLGATLLIAAAQFQGQVAIFFLYLVLAFSVHTRPEVLSFYWDEWHLMLRYALQGAGGAIYMHNEHFVPLYFLIYYFQSVLFGDSYYLYIAASIFFHAMNALILRRILLILLLPGRPAQFACTLLAALFVINSLHVEIVQWAFGGATLFFQTATLIALLLTLKTLEKPSLGLTLGILVASFSAPLLFGNGFILPALVASCAVLFGSTLPVNWRALSKALFAAALGAGLAALLYFLNSERVGHGTDHARPFEDPKSLLYYLGFGSQFAGVLRALGLVRVTYHESPRLPDWSAFTGMDQIDSTLAAGVAVSLFILGMGLALAKQDRARALQLWLFGQAIVIGSLLLPAVGRWPLGPKQSVALRYHYSSVVGVCIMLAPIVFAIGVKLFQSRAHRLFNPIAAFLLWVGLTGYSFSHLLSGSTIDYFTKRGYEIQLYLSELEAWNKQLSAISSSEANTQGANTERAIPYQGVGTELVYLEPLNANHVTVGRYPDEIYAVLNYLNPERYPLRAPLSELWKLCPLCSANEQKLVGRGEAPL